MIILISKLGTLIHEEKREYKDKQLGFKTDFWLKQKHAIFSSWKELLHLCFEYKQWYIVESNQIEKSISLCSLWALTCLAAKHNYETKTVSEGHTYEFSAFRTLHNLPSPVLPQTRNWILTYAKLLEIRSTQKS